MSQFQIYLAKKTGWFLIAFFVALAANFFLPRLIPGNPVDILVANAGASGTQARSLQRIYETYITEFHLNDSSWQQFMNYLSRLASGDMGTSFSKYPKPVSDIIGEALPWTIMLQIPAILVGWIIGNILGALAAYRGGWFDKGAFTASLIFSAIPYYCLAIMLLYGFAVHWEWFPANGGYSYSRSPTWTSGFVLDAAHHYWLPFFSLVLVIIGGQAIGMRSMSIYELGTDYVGYSRAMGVPDSKIVNYVFRNSMLPQVTGLALAIGSIAGGALITEIVFSYPGIGTVLFSAIRQSDYPLIQGVTLVIAVMVLVANFLVDIAYGFIDPRIRAAQLGGG